MLAITPKRDAVGDPMAGWARDLLSATRPGGHLDDPRGPLWLSLGNSGEPVEQLPRAPGPAAPETRPCSHSATAGPADGSSPPRRPPTHRQRPDRPDARPSPGCPFGRPLHAPARHRHAPREDQPVVLPGLTADLYTHVTPSLGRVGVKGPASGTGSPPAAYSACKRAVWRVAVRGCRSSGGTSTTCATPTPASPSPTTRGLRHCSCSSGNRRTLMRSSPTTTTAPCRRSSSNSSR